MKLIKGFMAVALVGGTVLAAQSQAQDAVNDAGISFGGYVDAGYTWIGREDNNKFFTSDKDTGTFHVSEGAIYAGKKFDNFSAQIDAAFGPSGSFDKNKSQAYITGEHESGLIWTLGQFDGLFGYYAGKADSHQYNLTNQGIIQSFFPRTQTGLVLGYSLSDMLKVSALVANDREDNNGNAQTDGNGMMDYGVIVNADMDNFGVDLGWLFESGNNSGVTPGAESELGYVGSLAVTTTFEPVTLGLYGMLAKPNYKDTDSDFGVGLDASTDLTEMISLGLRGEWLSLGEKNSHDAAVLAWNNPFGTNSAALLGTTAGIKDKSILAVTVGPQFKLNDHVTAKLDYTLTQIDMDTADETFHTVSARAVAHF